MCWFLKPTLTTSGKHLSQLDGSLRIEATWSVCAGWNWGCRSIGASHWLNDWWWDLMTALYSGCFRVLSLILATFPYLLPSWYFFHLSSWHLHKETWFKIGSRSLDFAKMLVGKTLFFKSVTIYLKLLAYVGKWLIGSNKIVFYAYDITCNEAVHHLLKAFGISWTFPTQFCFSLIWLTNVGLETVLLCPQKAFVPHFWVWLFLMNGLITGLRQGHIKL